MKIEIELSLMKCKYGIELALEVEDYNSMVSLHEEILELEAKLSDFLSINVD